MTGKEIEKMINSCSEKCKTQKEKVKFCSYSITKAMCDLFDLGIDTGSIRKMVNNTMDIMENNLDKDCINAEEFLKEIK